MDNNDADHTKLDAQLGKRFSKEQKEQLRDENLLGYQHSQSNITRAVLTVPAVTTLSIAAVYVTARSVR